MALYCAHIIYSAFIDVSEFLFYNFHILLVEVTDCVAGFAYKTDDQRMACIVIGRQQKGPNYSGMRDVA